MKNTLNDGRLLVFAHEAEAQAFERVPHFITGIGKLSAAVALAKLLTDEPVREIVVLGTAGMIDDALDLDTVYRINKALQHDLAFGPPVAAISDNGRVTMHGSVPGKKGALPGESADAGGVNEASVRGAQADERVSGSTPLITLPKNTATAAIATGDIFVTDDAVRTSLAEQGAGLVDMESYAFAALAASFGVPLKIFKVPSDFADSDTSDETWDDVVARKSLQLLEFADHSRLI